MLTFDILDPSFAEKQNAHHFTQGSEFQKQLATFKFFMDLLMKFDIELQIKKTLST
jgi:hypothetical protein